MDKNILKKFAIESRQDLMKKIEVKLKTFYVDEEFSKEQRNDIYVLTNEKHSLNLTDEQYKKRELLVKRIKDLSLEQVIEEAAYTWFNRIIAIRYMELNDMLPLTKNNSSLGIRVLSSKDNKPDPEIMKFTNLANPDLDINFKKEHYAKLTEESKFEYVLLLVCKKLGQVIPQVFDGVTDYIDILIPDNLLNDTGFVNKVVTDVPENNFTQVEVIGWLYQYYNQTEKDRVIMAKKVYKKTEIPYATQLFTPDWIVKYMVENSLGKYWLEHSKDSKIKENWKYYVDNEIEYKENIQPTEITFIDPCSGSGHILVYAFEVLYQIYQSVGYNKADIPELILKNNIYGLDIDDRAGQLSILSILLKARGYDKNIFNKDVIRNLNVMSIQESANVQDYAIDNLAENVKDKANYLKEIFVNAKEIGSLILLENNDYSNLIESINKELTLDTFNLTEYLIPLIKQANILSKKYDVVVTNPPYMGDKYMSAEMKKYAAKSYKEVKGDLFSMFSIRMFDFCKNDGLIGALFPFVWMFIKTYENLRQYIVENKNIEALIQLEYNAFEVACVPIGVYVFRNGLSDKNGCFIKLSDFPGSDIQEPKTLEAINSENCNYKFYINSNIFKEMPQYLIAYWFNDNYINIFKNSKKLSDIAFPRQGLATGDNDKFLRLWTEVNINNVKLNSTSVEDSQNSNVKWYPYNKGGEFRKWYGNNDFIVNWENNGFEIKNFKDEAGKLRSRPQNTDYYFNESITWSKISNSSIAFRYKPFGHIFDVAGTSVFGSNENLMYLIALNNSKVMSSILKAVSPTMNFEVGQIAALPIKEIEEKELYKKVLSISENNISLSKDDWDSFELSWNFNKHPLLESATMSIEKIKSEEQSGFLVMNNLEEAFKNWEDVCVQRFNQLKLNEIELNKIFIDIYGVQNELTAEVQDKEITIRKADRVREVKSLISYAVGCMFGRYSLSEDGLIYAGGDFNSSKYKHFQPDKDNVIPITDESYFTDDIVCRFKDFLEVVYGKGTLTENMDFVAEALGKKGAETSEEAIRRYFNNDFYNDHIRTYQKRPIYWLFDSGKKNGFKCLVYMHRYNDGLVAKVRLDYLHRIQTTYERLLNDVSNKLKQDDLDMSSKKDAQKLQIDLSGKLQETKEYDEMIAHIANQRINIDLDDGINKNYSKFVYTNPKTNKEESILGKIK